MAYGGRSVPSHGGGWPVGRGSPGFPTRALAGRTDQPQMEHTRPAVPRVASFSYPSLRVYGCCTRPGGGLMDERKEWIGAQISCAHPRRRAGRNRHRVRWGNRHRRGHRRRHHPHVGRAQRRRPVRAGDEPLQVCGGPTNPNTNSGLPFGPSLCQCTPHTLQPPHSATQVVGSDSWRSSSPGHSSPSSTTVQPAGVPSRCWIREPRQEPCGGGDGYMSAVSRRAANAAGRRPRGTRG